MKTTSFIPKTVKRVGKIAGVGYVLFYMAAKNLIDDQKRKAYKT